MVLFLKRDENVRVRSADWSRVSVREIKSAVRNADIVDNCDQLGLGNLLADRLIDLVTQLRRLLDAQAGACANMQLELPTIDRGKEILTEPRIKNADRQETKAEEANEENGTPLNA